MCVSRSHKSIKFHALVELIVEWITMLKKKILQIHRTASKTNFIEKVVNIQSARVYNNI